MWQLAVQQHHCSLTTRADYTGRQYHRLLAQAILSSIYLLLPSLIPALFVCDHRLTKSHASATGHELITLRV